MSADATFAGMPLSVPWSVQYSLLRRHSRLQVRVLYIQYLSYEEEFSHEFICLLLLNHLMICTFYNQTRYRLRLLTEI